MGKRKFTNANRGRTRSKKKTQQLQQQQDKTQQHIPRYFSKAKPRPKTKPKRKDHPNKAAAARVQQQQTTLTGHIVPKPHQRAGGQFKLTKPPKHVRITSSNYVVQQPPSGGLQTERETTPDSSGTLQYWYRHGTRTRPQLCNVRCIQLPRRTSYVPQRRQSHNSTQCMGWKNRQVPTGRNNDHHAERYRLYYGQQADAQCHPYVPNQHAKRRQAILDFEVILQFRSRLISLFL